MRIGDKKKLTCRKEIRLSEEELKQLQEKAEKKGMKESQYLRMLITNRPRDYPEIQDEIARLNNEINHIGVNINQIAKKVNTTGDLYPEEMQELKEMVKEIWHILKSSPLK